MAVYIYAGDAADFGNMGLAGELCPTRCEHEERAGGLSELTLEHPIDDFGRFSVLKAGMILKAPVPVRTTPEIIEGQVVTSVEQWTVKATAAKDERYLHTRAEGGTRLALVPPGTVVTVVDSGASRLKVKAGGYGSGWMDKSALEMALETVLPPDAGAIEQVQPAVAVRDQLFRIYECEQTDVGILCRARHISYDLLGNCTDYRAAQPTAQEALTGILGHCSAPHPFTAATDIGERRADIRYERVNPIKALLDPEDGILSRYGAQLVRDNFELYLLRRAGLARGVRIEYGRNLLGVRCALSTDGLVTAVLPVGEDADGSPLLLEGNPLVVSERADAYPAPHIEVLSVPEAKVGAGVGAALCRARLREAAQARLQSGCDLPEIHMSVDFVRLADCEGYRQYAALEDVFLYDTVTISHQPLGLELSAQVVETRYDCLNRRFLEIGLGSAGGSLVTGTVASWQLPGGIPGGKILPGSLTGGKLDEGLISARHLQAQSVSAEAIQADSIGARHIQAQTFAAQKIVAAVSELVAANINQARIGEAEIDWAEVANLNALVAAVAKAQITTAAIDEARIRWAEIIDLTACVAEIARAQLTTAVIRDARINWAEIAGLTAAVAEIAQASVGSADVDYLKVKDLVSGTAIITEGAGGRLYINRLGVTEANMVSLTVGELVIKSDDGRFYALSAGEDGQVALTPKYIEGDDIPDGAIPGGKLIENTITARELDVARIFADEALIRAVKAQNIDAADLFASSAAFGLITANHLTSDAGANLDLRSNASIRAMSARDYLLIDDDGVTIGKNDPDCHFKVNIRADAVNVMQDGQAVAYFKGNVLHAHTAELERLLRVGGWAVQLEQGGGLGIYLG